MEKQALQSNLVRLHRLVDQEEEVVPDGPDAIKIKDILEESDVHRDT